MSFVLQIKLFFNTVHHFIICNDRRYNNTKCIELYTVRFNFALPQENWPGLIISIVDKVYLLLIINIDKLFLII